MSGRPPKPTALKAIEGNRGKRGTNKQEPDPEYLEADNLGAPSWLEADAREVWDEIAPQLQKARLLAKVDVPKLAMGCVATAQYRRASMKLGELAVRPATSEKGEQLNPWLIVQSMAFKQAFAVFREFGMSPAARTRIALQPQMDLFGTETPKNAQGDKGAKYFAAA